MRPGPITRRLRELYKALQDREARGKAATARDGSLSRQRKGRREAGLFVTLRTMSGVSLRPSLLAGQTAMRSSSSVGSRST